jgi:hypothetical protein
LKQHPKQLVVVCCLYCVCHETVLPVLPVLPAEKYFTIAVTGGFQQSLGNDCDTVLPLLLQPVLPAEKFFTDAVTGGFQYSLGIDRNSVLPGAAACTAHTSCAAAEWADCTAAPLPKGLPLLLQVITPHCCELYCLLC